MTPRCLVLSAGPPGQLLCDVGATLSRAGVEVEHVGQVPSGHRVGYRLVVLRDKRRRAIEWARRQRNGGTCVVPDPDLVESVRDRWRFRALATQIGLQVPLAAVGRARRLTGLAQGCGLPVVIKRRATHGEPVVACRTMRQVEAAGATFASDEEVVVERLVEGAHRTAYFVGDGIAVFPKAPWLGDESELARMAATPPAIAAAVLAFRQLGVSFGKLDVVDAADKLYCVDAGVFPTFRNVPEAAELLANQFHAAIALRGVHAHRAERPLEPLGT